ncbi:MAG: hypothetical protein KC442_04275 [Thermomicrobiales bacterium]|nr:hypothetical protein [Thermomicrobiales bacterium]
MTRRGTPLWRRWLSVLCLVLCCLAAPVALVTGWARIVLLDQQTYVQTVAPVASHPQLQALLAEAVTEQVVAAAVGETPTATQAVQARLLREVVGSASAQVVASPSFATAWAQANAELYAHLAAGLTVGWGEPVVLDLSPMAAELQAEIDAVRDTLPIELQITPQDLRIQVLDAASADAVRRALLTLNQAFVVSAAVAVLAAVLSVALAGDRLRSLLRLSFGLAVAMVVLIAALLWAQGWAAGGAASPAGAVALRAIAETVTQSLRLATIAAAVAALVLAGIFAGLGALRGSVARPRAGG